VRVPSRGSPLARRPTLPPHQRVSVTGFLGSNQEKKTDQMRKLIQIARRVTTMVSAINVV
jgi:hypothetical protein